MLFIRDPSKVKILRNILCKVTGKSNEANKSLRIAEDWILLHFNSINIMTITTL